MTEFTVKQVMDAVELWEGRATLGVARPLFFGLPPCYNVHTTPERTAWQPSRCTHLRPAIPRHCRP